MFDLFLREWRNAAMPLLLSESLRYVYTFHSNTCSRSAMRVESREILVFACTFDKKTTSPTYIAILKWMSCSERKNCVNEMGIPSCQDIIEWGLCELFFEFSQSMMMMPWFWACWHSVCPSELEMNAILSQLHNWTCRWVIVGIFAIHE